MKTVLQVQNLKCGGCATTIEDKLSKQKELHTVVVQEGDSSVSFEHEKPEDILAVKKVLNGLGYPTIDDENGMLKKAKSFISCASGKLKS